VAVIANWGIPKTGKEIKRFMATANYNRDFMKDFATIGAPLDKLREERKIKWSPALDNSFQAVKKLIMGSAVLVAEDSTKEVLIGTDASKEGVGFWRGQVKDEFRHIPSNELQMHQIEIIQYGSTATKKPDAQRFLV
jgi:hypothetical protein